MQADYSHLFGERKYGKVLKMWKTRLSIYARKGFCSLFPSRNDWFIRNGNKKLDLSGQSWRTNASRKIWNFSRISSFRRTKAMRGASFSYSFRMIKGKKEQGKGVVGCNGHFQLIVIPQLIVVIPIPYYYVTVLPQLMGNVHIVQQIGTCSTSILGHNMQHFFPWLQ